MHPIQQKLLELARSKNLAQITLREMAAEIGLPDESPQKVKHHLQQLQKKGLLIIDRSAGTMSRAASKPTIARGLVKASATLFSIPIVGTAILKQEAMGFGDVTLMAMIGAFLGWQACPLVFFVAPLAGVILAVVRWLASRQKEIPYGPFLCLAAVAIVVGWRMVWLEMSLAFQFIWLVPTALVACLVMLGLMLGFWTWLRSRLFGRS